MASSKKGALVYRCVSCGHTEPKWLGRCPDCGQWNSFRESSKAEPGRDIAGETFPLPLSAIDPAAGARLSTGFPEMDRVLGGGLMRGSSVLFGGEPGIGKSTLLLQICAASSAPGRILYVSGEESPAQVRSRAERLGALSDSIEVFCSSDLGLVRAALDTLKPSLVIVDSVQTLRAEEAGSVPGTANQVKYCAQELSSWAKTRGAAMIMVAHVTKDGLIAGPKAAEHLVDVVLGFEQGDGELRIVRALKNRFGSSEEVGLFRMGEAGLSEVVDSSGLFLVRREGGLPPGTAVAAVHEGSRVILVEIQALTVPAKAGLTRIYSERIDSARVSRVAAVLEKHTGLRFSDQDVYVNVAGGIRLDEPGVDLALACALYSARTGTALPADSVLAGELSLAGEVRPVRQMRRRAKAAAALGFKRMLGPLGEVESANAQGRGDASWLGAADIKAAPSALFG
jgi:DNA repair protein RadA/Sms